MTQYYFVDESGDPGEFEKGKGSSFFTLAMIQMPERSPIPQLGRIRRDLYLPDNFEFHYHQTSWQQKKAFFEIIKAATFRIRAAHLDKTQCKAFLVENKGRDLMIELITRLVFRSLALDIANDILILDGASPNLRQKLRIRLTNECDQRCRVRPFKKIVTGDSGREDGLQLADMVAGVIRDHLFRAESEYYRAISNKIVDLWLVD